MASLLELGISTGKWDSGLKKAQTSLNAFIQSQGGLQQALDKENEKIGKFVQMMGKMESTAHTAKGQLRDYKNSIEQLSAAYNRLSEEQKKSSTGQAMLQAMEQLKAKARAAKEEIDKLDRSLNNATGGSGGKMGQLGGVVNSLGGNFGKLGGIVNGLGGNFGQLGNALGGLTSQMGIAGESMVSLGATAGPIGAAIAAVTAIVVKGTEAWIAYNNELNKQDNITQVVTGLKGDDAEKMTNAVRALATTYNVDFREAINAANTLMSIFGVTGDEAIQLLRDGMQGMIMGDGPKLLQMIQQYAPAFSDAGISASQLVAIIHNSEGGIFTDQNMNAIVMGIKNIRTMTKSTSEALAQLGIDGEGMSKQINDGTLSVFDALQQVMDALQGVDGNSKAAGDVLQNVFGRQGVAAGTAIAQALETLNLNLDETKYQTGQLGQSYADLEVANERLNVAIRECFGYDGWSQMANGIKAHLIVALAETLRLLKEIYSWLVPLSTSLSGLGLKLLAGGGSADGGSSGGGSGGGVRGDDTPEPPPLPPKPPKPPKLPRGSRGGGGRVTTTTPAQEAEKKIKSAIDSYAQAIEKAQMELEAGVISEVDVKKRTLQAEESLWKAYNDAFRLTSDPKFAAAHEKYQTAQEESADKIKSLNDEIQSMVASQKAADKAAKELAAAEKKLADAQDKLAIAQQNVLNAKTLKDRYAAEGKLATAQANVTTAQANVDKLKSPQVEVQVVPWYSKVWNNVPFELKKKIGDVAVPISFNEENMSALMSKIKGDMSKADFGSAIYASLTEQMKDATTLSELVSTMMKEGLSTADFDMSGFWKQILNGDNIPDETWQGIVDEINAKLKAMKLKPINFDVNTGQVTTDAKEMTQAWQSAAQAIQAVGGAMSQIENPMAKVVGTIAQAIATIALTFAQSLKGTFTPWDWIAGAAAGVATMISTIAAIHSATGYAEGGLIKGNTYSNDQIPIMANAGEIVLNRAQQGNIASQLQGGLSGLNLSAEFSAEGVKMILKNNSRRTGRGEYLTSRFH